MMNIMLTHARRRRSMEECEVRIEERNDVTQSARCRPTLVDWGWDGARKFQYNGKQWNDETKSARCRMENWFTGYGIGHKMRDVQCNRKQWNDMTQSARCRITWNTG